MSLPIRDGFRLTVLPFAGFYDSVHDAELDSAEDQLSQDENGNPLEGDEADALRGRIWDGITWRTAHVAYAKGYVEAFADTVSVPLEFESLDSPAFYNYGTDRVFAWIADADCAAMAARALTDCRDILDRIATDRLTSYDGFASHYSPDVADWGEPAEWDHNLIGLALEALATDAQATDKAWSSWDELDIMESFRCNGYVDTWLWDAMNADARAAADELYKLREGANA